MAFTEAAIRTMVADWYRALDRHVDLDETLRYLVDDGLEMRFPETTARGHGGFADWYKGSVIALMGREGESLYDLDLRGPCAFVVGNECAGITADLAESARVRARIPTTKRVESINAGIAGSVALFECMRQRGAGKGRK